MITTGFGIGMFIYGMTCILIGAIIAYYIINKVQKTEEKLEQEEKRVWNLTSEERKELGYVGVEDYYHGGGGYHDENNFNYVLAEQLRKPLIDQEEN